MSNVTNVILSMGCLEDSLERIKDVNRLPSLRDLCGKFIEDQEVVQRATGGTKALEADIFIGAFNFLHTDDFLEDLKKVPWERLQEVQVFVKEQEEDVFTVFTLTNQVPERGEQ